ncbi:MAG: sugar transferase [Methylotenera sp.]
MKRLVDFFLSLLALLILWPVMILTALAILVKMGRPILFRQQRPGLHGKPFVIYKFRTMLLTKDVKGVLLPDEKRMTSLGTFLRKYSLDELPQLFNVLIGNLSLVGPRPLLMEYLPLYSQEQARRHSVKPGITGWAQVNGRNAISWEDKFKLDVWYVDNQSILLDVKILLLTIKKVFLRDGISAKGQVTMPKFTGSKSQ